VWALRHPATGYVQGINDLATPLYAVFLEPFASLDSTAVVATDEQLFAVEADVYWCLTRILDGMLVRGGRLWHRGFQGCCLFSVFFLKRGAVIGSLHTFTTRAAAIDVPNARTCRPR
jgi:hypothetical protein